MTTNRPPEPVDGLLSTDPYLVLGVDRSAGDGEIKRAYLDGVRRHPPERDPERFRQIRAAYERIRSSEARARTDLFLLQPPPDPPNRRAPSPDLAVHAEDVAALAWAEIGARLAAAETFQLPGDARDGGSR